MQQRDSLGFTIGVATALCIVCSLSVSSAYVILKPLQDENRKLDRQRNILDAAGLAAEELGIPASRLTRSQINDLYEVIEERFVDLRTGNYTTPPDGDRYDPREAVNNRVPDLIDPVPPMTIGARFRERIVRVYLVKDFKDRDFVQQVVIPVYGQGLWSTLYGYMAIRRDLETVQGLTFYDHAETPGLGGEVDNPSWKQQWVGLDIFDDAGAPVLGVNKGPAPPGSSHLVDGLSGATITSNGVTNMVRYWMSDDAYGRYFEQLGRELSGGDPVAFDEQVADVGSTPPQAEPGSTSPVNEPIEVERNVPEPSDPSDGVE